MTLQRVTAATLLLASTLACSSADVPTDAAGAWVGTVTTEGNVTTVINEAGSVWGGTATLVEEASIGVEAGAEEYMLGDIAGVWADGEHIVVVDRQVPALRVYDLDGNYLRNLGHEGQGPGEYTSPSLITGDGNGRVFVQDSRADRFNVFTLEGESLGTWPARNAMCCAYPMVATPQGTLWARTRVRDEETRETRYAVQEHGPDGEIGELRWPDELAFTPIEIDVPVDGRTFRASVFFSPNSVWVLAPSGAIVTGASDRYHFEVQSPDGAVLAVEKYWTPVSIDAKEADWWRRYFVSAYRREGGGDWTWDGDEIPDTKPAFSTFVPTQSGEIWVRREGPGEHLPGCAEDPIQEGIEAASEAPCWRGGNIIDAFDAEGHFLGEVETPTGLRAYPSSLRVRGDQVVGVVEDDLGTIRVKRWRLVPPR